MRKVSEVVYQIYELEKQKKKVIDLFTACYIYVYVNINVYFLQKKKKEKKNEIHLEFYRFVYRGLQRRNTVTLTFSFRSIFYVIYTEIRNANTFLLLQFLRDTQRVTLLINPFCLMNII